MTALAELEDLVDRLDGVTLATVDIDRGEALLEDASDLVRDIAGQDDWTDPDGADPAPARAIKIAIESARRAYVNPDGLITERLGDASWGYWHGVQPGVFVTKQEAESLRKAGESSFRSVTSVTPYNVDDDDPDGIL